MCHETDGVRESPCDRCTVQSLHRRYQRAEGTLVDALLVRVAMRNCVNNTTHGRWIGGAFSMEYDHPTAANACTIGLIFLRVEVLGLKTTSQSIGGTHPSSLVRNKSARRNADLGSVHHLTESLLGSEERRVN